jgi:hypothetical protein
MAILREEIKGTVIHNIIKSSNITESKYDTADKTMTVKFSSGLEYEYKDVPHEVYVQFRLAESQGKFFSSKISKVYQFKKLQ